ncbi:MAG TPA: hypothetical protein VL357_08050, partial [Rariglobus sp.]|nr:hypothetical protein [Rariglobus sp.]
DKKTGETLKVELIESPGLWGERHYKVRMNGKAAAKVPEATLTVVCSRLRGWMVKRSRRP